MMRIALPAALLATLAGCTTPAYVSPVEVTRFTGATPAELGMGTIAIRPAASLDPQSIEYGLFEAELAAELRGLGYTVVSGEARQLAVLEIDQSVRRETRRGPVSVGGGASTGSYGSGVGLGVGIDLSGGRADQILTSVFVAIRPAAGGGNLWEGRANFTATDNSDFADPALAADRVLSALFSGFPGRNGETITVE